MLLADEATKLLHGEACLQEIHATVKTLFGGKGGDDLESLQKVQLSKVDFSQDGGKAIPVCDMLVRAEMASSKAEARRLIKAGGARVNDNKVSDEYAVVTKADFESLGGKLKLSSGKKKHALILLPDNF